MAPAVVGVDPVTSRLLRASFGAEGDFNPGIYRWLAEVATAEEGAALEAETAAIREYRAIYQALAEADARADAARGP